MRRVPLTLLLTLSLVACGSAAKAFNGPGFCISMPGSLATWTFTPYSGAQLFDSWDSPDGQDFVDVAEVTDANTVPAVAAAIHAGMTHGEAGVTEGPMSLPSGPGWRITGQRPQTGSALSDFVYYGVVTTRHSYVIYTVGVGGGDADSIARSIIVGQCAPASTSGT